MKISEFLGKLAKILGLVFVGVIPETNILESKEEKKEKKAKDEGKKEKN
jgi:hypothetical protein